MTLRDLIARDAPLPLDQAVEIAAQILARWSMPTATAWSTATSSPATC